MSYLTDPCERCGSEKISSKSHTEVIETFSGKQRIEVFVIKCSNKACQKIQDEQNAITKKANDERKERKEQQETVRKNNIQLSRKKAFAN
jgi:hypothetical protein